MILPKLIPNSREYIKPEGVYLISNGEILVIYIGKEVDSEFLRNMWGVGSFVELYGETDY